eukprot:10482494-Ditylum_brightwellii.AAC.1
MMHDKTDCSVKIAFICHYLCSTFKQDGTVFCSKLNLTWCEGGMSIALLQKDPCITKDESVQAVSDADGDGIIMFGFKGA